MILALLLLAPIVIMTTPETIHARATPAKRAIQHQGMTRTFYVFEPPTRVQTANAKRGLVLALHGGSGNALQLNRSTRGRITAEAHKRGWVAIFPEGVRKSWNDGRVFRQRRATAHIDDVGFLSKVIDSAFRTLRVDPTRVYVTGISNGGFMSFRLATDLSTKIAAIAPVTATLSKPLSSRKPPRIVPVLMMNGTEDPLVPYGGGHVGLWGQERGAILSTDATAAWFATRLGCTKTSSRTLPNRAPRDGTTVDVIRHTGCAHDGDVVIYRINGGGHTWPGSRQNLPRRTVGRTSRDIDGCEHIFAFFDRHRIRDRQAPSMPSTTEQPGSGTPR